MYDSKQLKRDFRTILYSMGTASPYGFHTKWLYENKGLQLSSLTDEIMFKKKKVDIDNVGIDSELGQLVLDIMVRYEERYAPIVIHHENGIIETRISWNN